MLNANPSREQIRIGCAVNPKKGGSTVLCLYLKKFVWMRADSGLHVYDREPSVTCGKCWTPSWIIRRTPQDIEKSSLNQVNFDAGGFS